MKQSTLFENMDIPGTLVSAKRKKNERSGVHSWHPYYAGYSESFVRSAIGHLDLKKGMTVLDPWCGSGTTMLVCDCFGLKSRGLDVNPAMAIFSASKFASVELLEDLKVNLGMNFTAPYKESENEGTSEVLSDSLSSCVESLKKFIADIFLDRGFDSKLALSSEMSFFYAVLFVTTRQLSGFKKGSNPTWFRNLDVKPECTPGQFAKTYLNIFEKMMSDLPNNNSSNADVFLGDCRERQFRANSMDAVITSPPYLTRIDYAISTKMELLILENSTDATVRDIRDRSMGATSIRRERPELSDVWGKTSLGVLDRVANHSTKSARNYYWKNMIQYFSDAELSLTEIKRVLRKNGRAILVVQSSYFKEIEIPLGDIYIEMAHELGMQADRAFREVVRGHLAHVNSKSSSYVKNKTYYEDFIEITKI